MTFKQRKNKFLKKKNVGNRFIMVIDIANATQQNRKVFFGLGLFNPSSDLPKQHPISHKDILSGPRAGRKPATVLQGQHYLYYFLLVYIIPHGRFYINTHPRRYAGLQSYKLTGMAVGILPHADRHALGSSGKHWLCVFLFIVWL